MGVRWRAYVPAGRQVRSEAPPWPSFVLYFVLMGEVGIQHGLWDPVPLQLRHRNSKMSLVLQYPMQYCSSSAVICGCHPFLQPHSAVVFRGSRSPLPGGGRHARCRLLTRLHAQAEESGGAHVEESWVDPIHPSDQQILILNEPFLI